jgi:formate hydrogenlyase subunit 6/NADH:ubiquinone oxidoreductase subunit I
VTNIVHIIYGNLTSGPETLRYPDRVTPAARFRGAIIHNPERCIACGICDAVCVSGATELHTYEDHAEWSYDPGRCTFCSRCVAQCPVGALRQEDDRIAPYANQRSMVTKHIMAYPTCPVCGSPALPFGKSILRRAFSGTSDEIFERAQLCERCRQRRTQTALRDTALMGPLQAETETETETETDTETEGDTDER